MLASARMSASACWMTSSKTFERWLTSRIDMPMPGSATRSRWNLFEHRHWQDGRPG
jgi:hypothetical protein